MLLLLLTLGVVLLMPVGHSSYAEGLVSLPQEAYIRAGTDGVISEVLAQDGEMIMADKPILRMENLQLATDRDILLARQQETVARHREVLIQDRKQAEIFKAQSAAIESELADLGQQIDSLQLNSVVPGLVSLPLSSDLPGRYVKRGEVIGYVANLSQVTAQVVISQSAIDSVRNDLVEIRVRLKSRPDEVIRAQLLREQPQVTDRLPSRLLGSGAGGNVSVDVSNQSGVKSIDNIFQLEIGLPIKATGIYLGQRVYVRFIHSQQSIGRQLLTRFEQLLMRLTLA